jgi:hypothetical protein
MMLFPIWIEHPLNISVQRSHDADARRIFPEQLYGSVIAADDLLERVKQMSIIPNLAMLGLAAALSSPMRHHQIDFKMTSLDGIQRINQQSALVRNLYQRGRSGNSRSGKGCDRRIRAADRR